MTIWCQLAFKSDVYLQFAHVVVDVIEFRWRLVVNPWFGLGNLQQSHHHNGDQTARRSSIFYGEAWGSGIAPFDSPPAHL